MMRSLTRFGAMLVAGTATLAVAPASAQYATAPQPTSDADALADAMRRLGANPLDLNALIGAGELSLRLGDASAAAALFRRAEQIDPMNGRVKAGMARILVTQERPGEALRYFDQAIGYGLDPRSFAGDRGLAYDLIGEQERAQRDYRLALKAADVDEVRRRYALSLGISGRQKEALEQIDTLLRRNDRGAWRARTFILAMTGDLPGAQKLTEAMMPGPMAQGLAPFLARLATLGATDRAFAVHFGEVRSTAQRLADARMVPPLAPLGADPDVRPVQVAAVQPAPVATKKTRRDRERDRRRQTAAIDRIRIARAAPRVVLPVPRSATAAVAVPRQGTTPAALSTSPASVAPTRVAAARIRLDPIQRTTLADMARLARLRGEMEAARRPAAPAAAPAATTSAPVLTVPAAAPVMATSAVPAAALSVEPPVPPSTAGLEAFASTPGIAPAVPASTPVAPGVSETSILAGIVAGAPAAIPPASAPTSPPPPPPPAPVASAAASPPAATPATPSPEEIRALAAKRVAEDRAIAARKLADEKKAAAARKAAEARAAAAKKAADEKALAAKKAAEEKALAAKKAAEEKKAARADPARIWVQVAGGAFAGDLPKAWAAVRTKAPALAGRQGYSTPLRATNRVVTGPFKTPAEAQALVNELGKQGVSAFSFTSAAGQKVTRLPPR